ncbi:hypothetical protein SDC9_185040 [bioreactor metagenome]|uniref:Uncharacterized protein n=1 Tax=bioreactor metagenome TaxID=1076179 RepID=A0A645HFK4_9ZZZZ
MIPVRAEAALIILAEYVERDAIQYVFVITAGQIQFADGLLREYGQSVVFFEHANVAGGGDAQAIAHANGALFAKNGNRRGEREQPAQRAGVFMRKGSLYATTARGVEKRFADEQRIALRNQKILFQAADHEHGGAVRRKMNGTGIDPEIRRILVIAWNKRII